jgi:ribosomal protein L7Ae-like RNA K-turn-binding protein
MASAAEQYRGRIDELLAVARRNRRLLSGARRVRESLRTRGASLIVVAGDASSGLRRMAEAADGAGARGVVTGTKARLGRASGRRPVGAVAVLDPKIAERILSAAESAAALEEVS